jgi:hypothetical protein
LGVITDNYSADTIRDYIRQAPKFPVDTLDFISWGVVLGKFPEFIDQI